MGKKLIWIAEAIAMACEILLLIFFLPFYVLSDAMLGPGMSDLELIGLVAGVIINWILLFVFIKKIWNKIILLLLFLPVVGIGMGLAGGLILQVFNFVLFVFGLSLLFQPHEYHQFLKRHFKKKVSPLLIRIVGGLMAIAFVLWRALVLSR